MLADALHTCKYRVSHIQLTMNRSHTHTHSVTHATSSCTHTHFGLTKKLINTEGSSVILGRKGNTKCVRESWQGYMKRGLMSALMLPTTYYQK